MKLIRGINMRLIERLTADYNNGKFANGMTMKKEGVKMTVFVRYNTGCREFHYKAVWECKTGNILTRSSISAEEAIRLHEKKLNKLGLAIGQVKLMGGN